jgi:hypothetical protein
MGTSTNKPCPFCGSEPRAELRSHHRASIPGGYASRVVCANRSCEAQGPIAQTPDEAWRA